MTSSRLISVLHDLYVRELNTSASDPRVGSARDNATTTSISGSVTTGTNSSSFSTLFVTLIPIIVYAVLCVFAFLALRQKWPRVYMPRTFLTSLDAFDRTPELPSGRLNWWKKFYETPDLVVLNRSSLDGFLFLRYLKVLCVICIVGVLLTWPTLIPYHVHGGGHNIQMDLLTFGNVIHPKWFYFHAFLAWIYFGFILYMIARESVYFISLRQAYVLSPLYSNRLSSRTVLFTCVPQQILDERKLRRVFGDSVKNIWIPRDTEDLDELVKEREQTADRLEKAEIQLIKKANAEYQKALKHGHPDIETHLQSPESEFSDQKGPDVNEMPRSPLSPQSSISPEDNNIPISPLSPMSPGSPREFVRTDGTPILKTSYGFDGPADVNGSIAAQWIPYSHRPFHRPIANYGRRVDTIKWTRNRLKKLAPEISKLRSKYRKGHGKPIPSVFIEFHTQVDAQIAYQSLAHHRANHMRPEIIGVRPQEIIWSSLRMAWWERVIRGFAVQAFVAVMVVFFSVPAAIVGIISNVKTLSSLSFLKWLVLLPDVILGLVSGLLPAVALAALMAIVPMILRVCARQSGVSTESRVELFVQNAYFLFQIVQVFLITTLTSAASAAILQVIKNPLSARSLLSQNLPKASNFYISYFILQGLAMSASRLVNIGNILSHGLLGDAGNNPRKRAAKYHRLRKIHWGSVYPVFTNMGVIAISYSLIAPVVLGVAVVGFALVYLCYRWNLLYVYSSERDTRGLHYPCALSQTLTGVYLAEICIVGLFGIQGAYGPLVLTFGLIIFTTLFHISLNDALNPLIYNLPRTVAAEELLRQAGNSAFDAENLDDKNDVNIPGGNVEAQDIGYDSDFDPSAPNEHTNDHGEQNNRGGVPIEGGDAALKLTTKTLTNLARKKIAETPILAFLRPLTLSISYLISPPPNPTPNFILKFLHPEIYQDFHILRKQIPEDIPNHLFEYEESVLKDAYLPPGMLKKVPRIWIPRDAAGVSKQEVRHCASNGKGCVECTDEEAWLSTKGVVEVNVDGGVAEWVERGVGRVKF